MPVQFLIEELMLEAEQLSPEMNPALHRTDFFFEVVVAT